LKKAKGKATTSWFGFGKKQNKDAVGKIMPGAGVDNEVELMQMMDLPEEILKQQ